MPSLINNAKHWRARAEAARALAAEMTDKVAQRMMLRIARDFDRLANRAEKRDLAPEERRYGRKARSRGAKGKSGDQRE